MGLLAFHGQHSLLDYIFFFVNHAVPIIELRFSKAILRQLVFLCGFQKKKIMKSRIPIQKSPGFKPSNFGLKKNCSLTIESTDMRADNWLLPLTYHEFPKHVTSSKDIYKEEDTQFRRKIGHKIFNVSNAARWVKILLQIHFKRSKHNRYVGKGW